MHGIHAFLTDADQEVNVSPDNLIQGLGEKLDADIVIADFILAARLTAFFGVALLPLHPLENFFGQFILVVGQFAQRNERLPQ
ncbi:hypothetical protein EUZ85_04420 [Hahella sp. KA22]|uniref:hypothetical protein n=1 Tax=Hahella sp. KA22 TaxID=1628392 RepID=UPI0010126EB8|nr:hypothetical protein [Hahella sp. KA22]QAY53361.1 hypothetical protein EUZ85_04420 [Hahella sp. KA22]